MATAYYLKPTTRGDQSDAGNNRGVTLCPTLCCCVPGDLRWSKTKLALKHDQKNIILFYLLKFPRSTQGAKCVPILTYSGCSYGQCLYLFEEISTYVQSAALAKTCSLEPVSLCHYTTMNLLNRLSELTKASSILEGGDAPAEASSLSLAVVMTDDY